MSTHSTDIVEVGKEETTGGTRLGSPDIGSSSQPTRRNAAKRNRKTSKNKKPKMEDLLERLEELNNKEESETESESESESDSESYDSSDYSSDSDSDDDLDISAELDESDVDAQKVKVEAAELGHKFLIVQMESQETLEKPIVMNPLIACCASGNIDLLDEILQEGLFCPKSHLLFLFNACAAYPIQDLAMKMYDAIKEGAAACSGDPDAGYDPCKYCEPKKKKGKGGKRKKGT